MSPSPRSVFSLLALTLCLLAPFGLGCSDGGGATAYRITTANQLIGGPAADAWLDDYILENEKIRVAILDESCQPDPGMGEVCETAGPGIFGGTMVDIDLRRSNSGETSGRGHDRFAELFSTVNMDVTDTERVEILADGSDGGPAIVRTSGPAGAYVSYIGLIRSVLGLPATWQYTDYILKPGASYLTLRTTAVVVDDLEVEPPEPCGWTQGDEGLPCDEFLVTPTADPAGQDLTGGLNDTALQFGDFFLAGADVDLFLPHIGFDEKKAVHESAEAGVNNFVTPFAFPYLAATGQDVSYAIGSGGTVIAPLFTASLTVLFGALIEPGFDAEGEPLPWASGTTLTYERSLAVGDGDVGSALDSLFQAYLDDGAELSLGRLEGNVLEESTLEPLSGIRVLVYQDTGGLPDSDGYLPEEDLYTEFVTDNGDDRVADGSFGGRLPAGRYFLVAKHPDRAGSLPVRTEVLADATTRAGVIAPRTAALEVSITDSWGRPLPSKISMRPLDEDTPTLNSQLGDPYFAGGFTQVVFAPYGEARIEVPAGRYEVFVTRGIEYGLWDSSEQGWTDGIVVTPGEATRIDAVLPLEVDSTGFISADFHVHAHPSHDSGVPLEARVITMACEGVEFLSSSDHDYLTDYRPVIEDLGLDPWVQATIGTETTTVEVGHYLGFPLTIDYTQAGDGSIPWLGRAPVEIIRNLKDRGAHSPEETAVFIGHPRDGILGYFDQFGLDPFSGDAESHPSLINALSNPTLGEPSNFTLDFDGFEILNAKRFELIRTPTHLEASCQRDFDDGEPRPECPEGTRMYDIVSRTMEEQLALADLDQPFFLDTGDQGQVDDWFHLLNLGYRHTALGNSDTHGLTSTEAGCPRNFVVSDVDSPEFVDERAVARAVQEHRVVASYGPLIDMNIDGAGIGSDVSTTTGEATLSLKVQAPRWMRVDRIEIYENARLIRELEGAEIHSDEVVKFEGDLIVRPRSEDGTPIDAWYVAIAIGDQDLAPLFTPVQIPNIEFSDVVLGAVSSFDLGGFDIEGFVGDGPGHPRTFPVLPYAVTNPIWLDVDGDQDQLNGPFEPIGRTPDWFRAPPEEEE